MDGLFAHIAQEKSPGPVRAFRVASSKAGLPEQGGLLIAQDAVNRQAVRQAWDALGDPKMRVAGSDLGKHLMREVELVEAPIIPGAGLQIHQERAAGVGRVGRVGAPGGESVDQKRVDRTEGKLTCLSALDCPCGRESSAPSCR